MGRVVHGDHVVSLIKRKNMIFSDINTLVSVSSPTILCLPLHRYALDRRRFGQFGTDDVEISTDRHSFGPLWTTIPPIGIVSRSVGGHGQPFLR